ncbi:MAG: hypothetical protein JWM89_2179 [Acidimicrobiales bacterium]|nr:hypothetical protein [Acidimicrobiales bacterium]
MPVSNRLEQVAMGDDSRRVQHDAVNLAQHQTVVRILSHGLADLGLKSAFHRSSRSLFRRMTRRKVREVASMTRLTQVCPVLKKLV